MTEYTGPSAAIAVAINQYVLIIEDLEQQLDRARTQLDGLKAQLIETESRK